MGGRIFIGRMTLGFRSPSKKYSFALIQPAEVDQLVEAIVKSESGGILRNKDFLKRAMINQDSTITIAAKKKGDLMGVVNGLAIRNQPVSPQITFIWVKDRTLSLEGVPQMLIETFEKEARKRNPKASSLDVNLPTFDFNSIALYSVSGFLIEGFIKGLRGGPDVVIMRRGFQKPSKTPVA